MDYEYPFLDLNNDDLAPKVQKLNLQQFDNYGIYSVCCRDRITVANTTAYNYQKIPDTQNTLKVSAYGNSISLIPLTPATSLYTQNIDSGRLTDFLAYQSYHINKINIDFQELINICSPLSEVNNYQRVVYALIEEIPFNPLLPIIDG
jgi:hypothetical protein